MTKLENFIDTLQNAPIEETACFIHYVMHKSVCSFCAYNTDYLCIKPQDTINCVDGIKQYLESEEVEEGGFKWN